MYTNKTKIKLCGLTRTDDIEAVNTLQPDFIGFVFAEKSKRFANPEQVAQLKKKLCVQTESVGVFVNESPETVADYLNTGLIDIAQLHGQENESYIQNLRSLTGKPIIKAFRIDSEADVTCAANSTADYVLLDAGTGGTGTCFDWDLVCRLKRPYFLAGGLHPGNVCEAIKKCTPYAVDVSSGIETDGIKDRKKMEEFVAAVRSLQI